MPNSHAAYLWPSWPVTSAPTSQPAAAYREKPSTCVISDCQRSAIFQKFMSGRDGSGVEKPNPGNDGTMTSKPRATSGSTTFDQCQNVHGQPWVRINGTPPTPWRMK